jgi:hypothetical protein
MLLRVMGAIAAAQPVAAAGLSDGDGQPGCFAGEQLAELVA